MIYGTITAHEHGSIYQFVICISVELDSKAGSVDIEIFGQVGGLKDDRGATNFALICCDEKRLNGINLDKDYR